MIIDKKKEKKTLLIKLFTCILQCDGMTVFSIIAPFQVYNGHIKIIWMTFIEFSRSHNVLNMGFSRGLRFNSVRFFCLK